MLCYEPGSFTQTAVSRHVGDLEQRLGARLLHRTTRRLSLTDDGQLFYARAKELLAAIDEAESEITSRSGEPSGLLRINAPLTFGVLHLAPLWGRFADTHPKVSLEIDLSDRIVDLVEEGYDLAVRITNLPSSQLVSRPLASSRMVLCASPDYLARHGIPAHPRDLAAHRVISYSYWSTRDELLPDYASLTIGIHAVYPSRKHLPIKTRRMVDFLVESFATPPWHS